MAISFKKQNMLIETSGLLCHGVNCLGVMGAGIAFHIKEKFPVAYKNYKRLVDDNRTEGKSNTMEPAKGLLGKVQWVKITNDLYIVNCFTQVSVGFDDGPPADAKAVESCLSEVYETAHLGGLTIKLPQIGCGLGGLSWEGDVVPILKRLDKKYNGEVETIVYSI